MYQHLNWGAYLLATECSWMYQDLNWGAYLLATVTKVDFVCWGPGDPVTGSSWKEDLRSVELGSLVERGREGNKNLLLSPMSQVISSDPPDHLPKLWDPAGSKSPTPSAGSMPPSSITARSSLSLSPWEQYGSVPCLQWVFDKYTLKCYMDASFLPIVVAKSPLDMTKKRIWKDKNPSLIQQWLLCLLASLSVDMKLLQVPAVIQLPVQDTLPPTTVKVCAGYIQAFRRPNAHPYGSWWTGSHLAPPTAQWGLWLGKGRI